MFGHVFRAATPCVYTLLPSRSHALSSLCKVIPTKVSSLLGSRLLALAFISLPQLVLSQTNAPCPGLNNNPYVDSNNVTYIIYCGYDGSTSASSTVGASSFAACMALCDNTANCVHVSYSSGNCYLKNGYTGVKTSSNVQSAVLCSYGGTPAYPPPVTNYVNASTGCGKALPSGLTPGAASTSQTLTAPDGRVRSFLVNMPASYNPNKAAPLIIAFHGQGESGSAMESESGYSNPIWNPYAIAIYPNGINVSMK